jgi:Na+/melibiose symporter-like transporter
VAEVLPPGQGGLATLLAPFRASRAFTTLFAGQALSRFGDAVLYVLLPLVTYGLSHNPLAMAAVSAAYTVPQLFALPLSGLLVDRMSRIWLMRLADLVRLIVLGILAILLARHSLDLREMVGGAILYGLMDAVFLPAYGAVRAEVFLEPIRTAANSLTQTAQQVAMVAGPAVGGLLATLGSPAAGLAFDALTFLVSFVSLSFLTLPPRAQVVDDDGLRLPFLAQIRGGLDALRPHPWLWQTILVFSVTNIASNGLVDVLVPWYVKVHLSLPGDDYGFAMTGMAAGSLIMAFVYGQRARWRRRGMLAYAGAAVWALSLGAVALFYAIVPIVLVLAVSGAGAILFALIWEISLQEMVPVEYFGRVVSLDMLGSTALVPAGYLAIGALADAVGGVPTLLVTGALGAVIMLAMIGTPAVRQYS